MDCVKPVISVIMSVYNEPICYLEKSIQSILDQTYSNLELIIVLDSPENIKVKEYLEEAKKKDNRVKLLINEHNLGLPKSLNLALQFAKGEYVARMDADDISMDNRLETELSLLVSSGSDLVASKVILIDANGHDLGIENTIEFTPSILEQLLRIRNYMPHPTWFGKKELFYCNKGYREIHACEDYDFLLRALKKGARLNIDNTPRLFYRINNNGISRSNSLKQMLTTCYLSENFDHIEDALDGLNVFLDKYLTPEAIKRFESMRIVNLENGHNYFRNIGRFLMYPEMRILYLRKIKTRRLFKRINL